MSDAAMVAGVRALWEQGRHIDFHIQVGDRSFSVHKVIMSSVSSHFKTLLSGETDRQTVHLDEVSSSVMESLINFVYKGQMVMTKANMEDILDGAVYLGMQSAVDTCAQFMMSTLDVANSMNMLSVFQKHSLEDNVKRVKFFIESNFYGAYKDKNPTVISYDELLFVMDSWRDPEVNLFSFVKKWVDADYNGRKKHINALMERIRFCLMTPAQLKHISSSKIYRECFGVWRGLVDEATSYHKLPINIKILNDSEQSTVRGKSMPTCFMSRTEDSWSFPCLYTLDKDGSWKIAKVKLPEDCPHLVSAVVVNNFLIVSPMFGGEEGQEFYVFDPRTLAHSQLVSLKIKKEYFTLVHHKGCLYAVGNAEESSVKGSVEKYDLQTNKWSHFVDLPYPVSFHTACVFNDCIYISGGNDPNGRKVECLDLSTKTFESKAPMLTKHSQHQMCVMKLHGQEVICVLDKNFQLEYYNASANQWVRFTSKYSQNLPGNCSTETMIVHGNTVFYYDDHGHRIRWMNAAECFHLTYPEDGDEVAVEYLKEHFLPYPDDNNLGLYAHGAMLTVPPNRVSTPRRRKPESPPKCYEDCFPEKYYRRQHWY